MITQLRRALARRLDPTPPKPAAPPKSAAAPKSAPAAKRSPTVERTPEEIAARQERKRQRREGRAIAKTMKGTNAYAFSLSDKKIQAGAHRKTVGPKWDETGQLQYEFLVKEGLLPEHRLLDVGCGAMRGGIHFARYLDPGHYYGIDVNESLLRAAREYEIPQAGLQDRMPAENLKVTPTFESDFGVRFDFALAQSVFTHLPLNHIRLCLWQVAKVMNPGGRFLATFFFAPDDLPYDGTVQQAVRETYVDHDPFHYRVHELEWAATVAEWDTRYIGEWGHERGQQMFEFTRR